MTFEQFLFSELDQLRRYARLLTGNRDSAHDVLADALIKAHLRWNKIGRMEFPAAYVRSMVTNGFLSERRSWSGRFISSTVSGELPEIAGPQASRSVDDRDQLEQLLTELPQQQRAAIVLRYYFDLADDAIAAELRCSSGAVRSYISRGLTAIRQRESVSGRAAGGLLAPAPRTRRAHQIGEH
ncbi:RNA polymerase sigma-70 factor (sigma-E family) [Nakamurella sp. UYEF19]|uniref:SigE family RNA polymerase sigma factor n=1 Tax=Nakamurella sp. UYEF19 TaxID=1756392 RepID=UPI00339A6FB9